MTNCSHPGVVGFQLIFYRVFCFYFFYSINNRYPDRWCWPVTGMTWCLSSTGPSPAMWRWGSLLMDSYIVYSPLHIPSKRSSPSKAPDPSPHFRDMEVQQTQGWWGLHSPERIWERDYTEESTSLYVGFTMPSPCPKESSRKGSWGLAWPKWFLKWQCPNSRSVHCSASPIPGRQYILHAG